MQIRTPTRSNSIDLPHKNGFENENLLAVMFEATLVPWAEAVLPGVLFEVLTVVLFLVAFAGFIIYSKVKIIIMAQPIYTFK